MPCNGHGVPNTTKHLFGLLVATVVLVHSTIRGAVTVKDNVGNTGEATTDRGYSVDGPPSVTPRRPSLPNFNWDTIPTAFYGANRSGDYSDAAVATLAKYQLVIVGAQYTPCAGGNHADHPDCDVEGKIEHTLGRVKAIDPTVTGMFYLNTMFDFGQYTLHGKMLAAEAKGLPSFLRDKHGKIVYLCNDGNQYCNSTSFDWTKPHVRELWMGTITDALATGHVDAIWADHSQVEIGSPGAFLGQGPLQLCDGRDALRKCYNFTNATKRVFNAWHRWVPNNTQALVNHVTQGPVMHGPYMRAKTPCDFDTIRKRQTISPYLLVELPGPDGKSTCRPTANCLASFLAAAQRGNYLACFHGGATPTLFPEQEYPLGPPDGPAVERHSGVWHRTFGNGSAVVVWDNKAGKGNVTWS
jgi:hypothetical protein